MRFVLIVSLWMAPFAEAWIPPLNITLRDCTRARSFSGAVEFRLKHRQGNFEWEERILRDGTAVLIQWLPTGASNPQFRTLTAQWERQGYQFPWGRLESRSSVAMRYLMGHSPDTLRETLLQEQFIRKELLRQYAEEMTLEGDPKTWLVRQYYQQHMEIRYHPIPTLSGPSAAIEIAGIEKPGERRMLYLDRNLRGFARLEWQDGSVVESWSFESFTNFGDRKNIEILPRLLIWEKTSGERLISEVLSVRKLTPQQAAQWKNQWTMARNDQPPGPPLEGALRALTSSR